MLALESKLKSDAFRWQATGFLLSGTLFGAVHLTAWDFAFPTSTERTLWRIAGIITTAQPSVFLASSLYIAIISDYLEHIINDVLHSVTIIFAFVLAGLTLAAYVLARLFLLVEIFRTLCFLPPSAYVATWASNAPHLS